MADRVRREGSIAKGSSSAPAVAAASSASVGFCVAPGRSYNQLVTSQTGNTKAAVVVAGPGQAGGVAKRIAREAGSIFEFLRGEVREHVLFLKNAMINSCC